MTQAPPVGTPTTSSIDDFQCALDDSLGYMVGSRMQSASDVDWYLSLAYTIRDRLVDRWRRTTEAYYSTNPKFVYYLSAEYLPGRQLYQNLLYTGATDVAREALAGYQQSLDRLADLDPEPGLGNGGLGRLAACFLDSMATLGIPCVGYGIRYEYGIFKQSFKEGWQIENPDDWLYHTFPWEFPHSDDMVEVYFGGRTDSYMDERGLFRVRWIPEQKVMGEPYHVFVPGYETGTVGMLRLWRARASKEFDLQLFDVGDYGQAVEQKVYSENISKVLYPNDNNEQGRELRLKQEYFFVACSLRDIIRRFRLRNSSWDAFPDKVAIQLNDTHPTIAIAELMRILVDEYRMPWDPAWAITSHTFAYTSHTLMPEAQETWPVSLLGRLLPRHLEIIDEINRRMLQAVHTRYPSDPARLQRVSIISDGPDPRVRMAHLAVVGSHSVNGVAALQSKLLAERVMPDFAQMWPDRFNNKTNGVSPRRFIRLANPHLCNLITDTIGDGWINNLERLSELEKHVDDPAFRQAWRDIKAANKRQLAEVTARLTGIDIDPTSVYDVMVKRLHEYKRQLLKALHIITLYNHLRADPKQDIQPATFIFGAKAAPGYQMAKLIIRLINGIGEVVNTDPLVAGRLKVAFLPNFNVSLGEVIYPAADISEQISLAGKEASGTGNMKFALNGAVTVGTLDGANIEIRERVGADNFFLFGLTADEVFALQAHGYNPVGIYISNDTLRQAIDLIASGLFTGGDRSVAASIVESLVHHDPYMILADYQPYIDIQDKALAAYRDTEAWTRMSILNTARSGYFSSDRTIREYASDIWKIQPLSVPPP